MMTIGTHMLKTCLTAISLLVLIPGSASAASDVRGVLKGADVAGGPVVVVGLKDTTTLTEIADAGPYLVHGLDANTDRVAKTRARLHEREYTVRITVSAIGDGGGLPFVDSLVNLLVILDAKVALADSEVDRILAPGPVLGLPESGRSCAR
jgi:hypothetical protein